MPPRPQPAPKKEDPLKEGDRVGVAFSSGADSVKTLIQLQNRVFSGGVSLTLLHVNHGLRGPESEADEAFAVAFAQAQNLPIRIHRPALAPGNREQSARHTRYAWFHELLRTGEFDKIATGHTASDQAETVLFRFLRGSGTAGLAGIRPATTRGIIRPLLHLTREEVRDDLTARQISWREDSSNKDRQYARNRIRLDLLPALIRDWNPALPQILAQTAEWARAEEEYWDAEMRRLATTHIQFTPDSTILSAPELHALPLAAARRLIRFAIQSVKGNLRSIDFAHIDGILALVSNNRVDIPGLTVRRSFDQLCLARPSSQSPEFHHTLEIPGSATITTGSVLQLELVSADNVYNDDRQQLDWGRITGSLELRYWRSGDHYRRAGHSSDTKLKRLFHKARVPVWERQTWPVITCDNAIVWTRRFGPAAAFARSAGTRMVLLIRENPPNQNV